MTSWRHMLPREQASLLSCLARVSGQLRSRLQCGPVALAAPALANPNSQMVSDPRLRFTPE